MKITELEDGTHIVRGDRATIAIVIFRGYEGVGEAIRRVGDERNDDIGNLLAEGRAFQALGEAMVEGAQKMVRQADEEARERRNRERQRQEEERIKEGIENLRKLLDEDREKLRAGVGKPTWSDVKSGSFHGYEHQDHIHHPWNHGGPMKPQVVPDAPPFIARVVAAMARRGKE